LGMATAHVARDSDPSRSDGTAIMLSMDNSQTDYNNSDLHHGRTL
jgi:hypothetical protein